MKKIKIMKNYNTGKWGAFELKNGNKEWISDFGDYAVTSKKEAVTEFKKFDEWCKKQYLDLGGKNWEECRII